jgi:hypothetical protein
MNVNVIRVSLPFHLRTLVGTSEDLRLQVEEPITLGHVLDALEADYPMLRGTIREQVTGRRRPFVRFFACEKDLSYEPPDALLHDLVARGVEPLVVVGAIAGG